MHWKAWSSPQNKERYHEKSLQITILQTFFMSAFYFMVMLTRTGL